MTHEEELFAAGFLYGLAHWDGPLRTDHRELLKTISARLRRVRQCKVCGRTDDGCTPERCARQIPLPGQE